MNAERTKSKKRSRHVPELYDHQSTTHSTIQFAGDYHYSKRPQWRTSAIPDVPPLPRSAPPQNTASSAGSTSSENDLFGDPPAVEIELEGVKVTIAGEKKRYESSVSGACSLISHWTLTSSGWPGRSSEAFPAIPRRISRRDDADRRAWGLRGGHAVP